MTQFAKDLDDAILTAITSTMLAHPGAPKGLIIGCLIDKLAFVFAAASSDKDYDRKVVLDFCASPTHCRARISRGPPSERRARSLQHEDHVAAARPAVMTLPSASAAPAIGTRRPRTTTSTITTPTPTSTTS